MAKEQKAKIIHEIADSLKKSRSVVITNYSGMTTADLNSLRRTLKASGVEYRVVKNTLARFAADESGKEFSRELFEGPVAAAFGYDDPVLPAKLLVDFTRNPDVALAITGGILGDRVISVEQVKELATLPPREVLIARVLGGMQAPLTGLANVLTGPIRGLGYLLQARIKKLEEET